MAADDSAKSCKTCESTACSSKNQRGDETLEQFQERTALMERLCKINHKVVVLSGKGGVGKSTVAVNLAVSLALAGKRVGLLDIDIHGPSVPKLMGIEDRRIDGSPDGLVPVGFGENLKIMSIGLLLQDPDDAVIWRGPLKMGVIKQFLKDVAWGELDYLVVDCPPGTGDEPLSIVQLIADPDGAIVVTTPQDLAVADVRKCITFCRQLKLRVLGVIENMSGLVCPKCGETIDVFKSGGGEAMAREMGVPWLGKIPLDPQIVEACDAGRPYVYHYAHSETSKAMLRVLRPIIELDARDQTPDPTLPEDGSMKIAIPLAEGKLSLHFGHCDQFALVEVDATTKAITRTETASPPAHEPGVLPRWLHEQGVNLIIASGMGQRAQSLFTQNGIQVLVGAPREDPDTLVRAYLDGTLQGGDNVCDH